MKVIKKIFGFGALMLASKVKGVGVTENSTKSKSIESTDAPFLQKLDYRKGDEAKTLAEYADAVKEEFDCEGNEIAKDMPHLWGSVLMVYGEEHTNRLYPKIRGSKGAVLLESEDSRICEMTKYTENLDNICAHIDVDESNDNINDAFIELLTHTQEMVELIEPGGEKRILSEATPEERETWKGGASPYLIKLDEFINRKSNEAYLKATPEKQYALALKRNIRTSAIRKLNLVVVESRGARDEKMFQESAKNINKLGKGTAATIVVGDNHVRGIVEGLGRKFPNRPIVACRTKSKIKM